MILHLVNDEKFIDMALRVFEEVYPGQNECIVLSETNELKYIKSTQCKIVDINTTNIKEFAITLKKYDAVILHSLDFYKLEVLRYLPKNVVTVWLGFGYDYYDLIAKDNTDLFDVKTKELYLLQHSKIDSNQSLIRNDKYILIRMLKKIKRLILGIKIKKDLVNKITFFAPVLNEEYKMVQNALQYDFKPRFLDWNYGTLEDDLIRGFENVSLNSNNILLGNSASYANNHLDAFDVLTKLDIKDRQIITPLSYGDSIYRDKIISEGNKLFGKDFMPLIDFMPIDEYISLISSCSVVIMNHIRQQALGNIITMMYLGTTIFLKKENPVYKFFKGKDATIFSIEELEKNHDLINYRLTKNEIEKNRVILRQNWSREVAQQKTKKLIDLVLRSNNA